MRKEVFSRKKNFYSIKILYRFVDAEKCNVNQPSFQYK